MAQMRVFVSHSWWDKAACDALVSVLRRAGADVWYDEHNLGAGQLLDEIQHEVDARPIFIVLLSKAAFASSWVRRETIWAFNLYNRKPHRLILPVTIGPIEASDFNNLWLFLEDFKRVEAPNFMPYPLDGAIKRTWLLLAVTCASMPSASATPHASESTQGMLIKSRALSAQMTYAEAAPFDEPAALQGPTSFNTWVNLGYLYGEAARWWESLNAYDRALALDDTRASIWNEKGIVLTKLERYDEALAAAEQALRLDGAGPFGWDIRATALRGLGRTKEAEAAEARAKAQRGK